MLPSRLFWRIFLTYFVVSVLVLSLYSVVYVAYSYSTKADLSDSTSWSWGLFLSFTLGIFLASLRVNKQLFFFMKTFEDGFRELSSEEKKVRVIKEEYPDEVQLFADSFNKMSESLDNRIANYEDTAKAVLDESYRLGTVFRGMIEGVIAIDQDEKIIFANPAAYRIIEFDHEKAIGMRIWEAIRNSVVQDVVKSIKTGKEQVRVEFDLPRKNTTMALLASRLPGDPCPGMVLVLHDVTELRRLENMRREFVSNVSHELKTPLASIQAYSETLIEGAIEDPDVGLKFVKRIDEQAERLHDLIQDILKLSSIESRQNVYQLSSIDLHTTAQKVIEDHQHQSDLRKINLHISTESPSSTKVLAESEGLLTILDNLVTNAIKYSNDGSEVILRWKQEEKWVRIECQDFGAGIPKEHLERIFERFHRVDQARSREMGGTGLGLSIVKHLASVFDGTINVESELDNGSTFILRLPAAM